MEAAVVSAAEGGLRILLGKLGSLLMDKYKLMSGVRKEIQYLKDELESMNALLRELAKNEDHDEQVKTWMKQVREIAYDAEDCVDNFVHGVSSGDGEQSGFTAFLRGTTVVVRGLKARLDVAGEIQALKIRAKEVSERRIRYKLDTSTSPLTGHASIEASSVFLHSSTQLPALYTDESQLVGVDGPRDMLLEIIRLDDNRTQKQVVAIVGFGGLGKTTLANAVYRSPKTQGSEFQSRAFVTVSQKVDVKTLLQNILKDIVKQPLKPERSTAASTVPTSSIAVPATTGGTVPAAEKASQGQVEDPLKGIEQWNEQDLIRKIHYQLKTKRYLLVLDDLWDLSIWEKINLCFAESNKGSRIIITTRDRSVAERCCPRHPGHDLIHEMAHLSNVQSERLFYRRVFSSEALPEMFQQLDDPSKKILGKCKGLPLAIVSIAGLLSSNPRKTREEWLNVHERLGSELESNAALKLMKQVLTMSYNDLPYHLKACFLYLSVYPEDHEIRRGALIRKWMAEGFVSGMRKMTVEEVAEGYFREFVSRSIVVPSKVDVVGKVQSCRVHDIMLEVIISRCIQENFLSILSDSRDAVMFQDKVRRLAIHECDARAKALARKSIASVRSLTIFDSGGKPPTDLGTLMQLRVLDVERWDGLNDKVLRGICKLFRLKYLSIRYTSIDKLPKQIGKLQDLETLDIRDTEITELPTSVGKIVNLKHLLMGTYYYYSKSRSAKFMRYTSSVVVPKEVGRMKALQTLLHVDATEKMEVLKTLGELDSLSKLSIYLGTDKAKWKPFFDSMENLGDTLRHLAVYQQEENPLDRLADLESPPYFLRSLTLEGPISMVPDWFAMLNNLTEASFINNKIRPDLMRSLGGLRSLISLSLHFCSYQDDRDNANVDRDGRNTSGDAVKAEDAQNASANGAFVDASGNGAESAEEEEASLPSTKFSLKKEYGFQNLKQLIINDPRNLEELIFEQGSLPNLERLSLAMAVGEQQDAIVGVEHLLKLKEIEFFGNEIRDLLVQKVTEMAGKLPQTPRIVRDDKPVADTQ